jgi:putative transposase
MSQIHTIQNGTIMFVTTNILKRQPIFLDPVAAREAVETLYRVQGLHPFFLFGFVIMPDHCHFLMTVPPPAKISMIMNSYKKGVAFQFQLGRIWQRGYHIVFPSRPWKVLEYIHLNPVRAGIAQCSSAYPWSSASGQWDVTSMNDV